MKITAPGDTWVTNISCEDCHVKLEIDDSDVRCHQYENTSQCDYYVKCPHCMAEIRVDVPKWVKSKAKAIRS